jgi:outer membrane immunogenic protein
MTHRLLIIALAGASLAAASPAWAQDAYSGFYAGANLGVTWGDTSSSLSVRPGTGALVIPPADVALLNGPISSGDDNDARFTAGVEGGYNYRMGNVLMGIEADFGAFDISEDKSKTYRSLVLTSPQVDYTLRQSVSTDWVWTVRPRLGYVYGPWLFFGTAGLGVTDATLDTTYADNRGGRAEFSTSETKTGFVGGFGAAYAFGPNWSVKGEWLHADFGKVDGSRASANGFAVVSAEGKVKANLLRIGADYQF